MLRRCGAGLFVQFLRFLCSLVLFLYLFPFESLAAYATLLYIGFIVNALGICFLV